jgi:hypothetical protein
LKAALDSTATANILIHTKRLLALKAADTHANWVDAASVDIGDNELSQAS